MNLGGAVNAVNAAYLDNSAADTYDCAIARLLAGVGSSNYVEDVNLAVSLARGGQWCII